MRNAIRTFMATASLCMGLATPGIAQEIRVGFVTSMIGPVASLGIPYGQGLKAGSVFIPSIGGVSIKLTTLDDGSDPTAAARNARKLVDEEKVDILIGTAGSPGSLAMATVAAESKTPLISIANANPQGEPGAWAVTVPQPATLMISAAVRHMRATGVKTVGYIGFSDAWGDLVYGALNETAPAADIKILSNERYARSDTSVTGQILKVMQGKPDAVIVGGSGTPGALPYIALKERGYTGKIYGTHAIINPDFIRVGGAAVEGLFAPTGPVVVFEQLVDGDPVKNASLALAETLNKIEAGVKPNAFSAYSFDAWLIFAHAAEIALRQAKPGTPEFRLALRDAIVNAKNVVGSHGVYNFKPDSRYGNDERSRVLVQLKNGNWQLVK